MSRAAICIPLSDPLPLLNENSVQNFEPLAEEKSPSEGPPAPTPSYPRGQKHTPRGPDLWQNDDLSTDADAFSRCAQHHDRDQSRTHTHNARDEFAFASSQIVFLVSVTAVCRVPLCQAGNLVSRDWSNIRGWGWILENFGRRGRRAVGCAGIHDFTVTRSILLPEFDG